MMQWRGAARWPLFLRIFVLMLICVAVVQSMNVALLIAVQAPTQKVYTVGQIADVMQGKRDPQGELRIAPVRAVERGAWNPRAERIEFALATAIGVSADRIEIAYPQPLFQRAPVYERSGVPSPPPLRNRAAARDGVVLGDFTADFERADGSWVRVEPVRRFEPWRWFGLLWLGVSVIAVAPFAWMLARRFAKPIRSFAAAAERLGRDPRAPPLELDGPSELAEAAAAFNQMQARLNRYVDDRTTVMGALAHDLRTPLMRLGLRLEGTPERVRAACEGDVRDMQAMISATLAYVRDTGQAGLRRRLDLRSLAETVTDDMADRGEPVTLAPGEPVVVEGNAAALKAMVTNLVSNAVKYAGAAEVSLGLVEGQAVLEVCDRGPGIPESDLEHIFEPFFRGERSRNRDTGGHGLGLASVRAVVRGHGGEVALENRAGGGLRARVVLPA